MYATVIQIPIHVFGIHLLKLEKCVLRLCVSSYRDIQNEYETRKINVNGCLAASNVKPNKHDKLINKNNTC